MSYSRSTESDKRTRRKNGKKWIGKVAKGTGNHVIKSGRKVGKVVSKRMIGHGKKAPKREPKLRRRRTEKRDIKKNLDHHVAVNQALSATKRKRRRKAGKLVAAPKNIMAGQLSAPDQSCRIVSHVLSEMSAAASEELAISDSVTNAISSLFGQTSELGTWFLRGGCLELGVIPVIECVEF